MILAMLWGFIILGQSAWAAWPDSSEGRIYSVALFRRDFQTPGNILRGDERTQSYEKACELKYYPACEFDQWTDANGLSDLTKAGAFFGSRCKSEALSCVVSGWAKGYVNGKPSEKAPNPTQAVEDLTWGCKKKQYAPACSHLGELYMTGVGTKVDYKQAQALFKEGCKAKDDYGCYVEGDLYYNGWGVTKNYLEAHKRYTKGCEQGFTQACVKLAKMYEKGQGIDRSNEKAVEYYGQACSKKDGDGCFNLARMYANGTGAAASASIAFAMYNTLCSAKDQRGCFGMAQLYEIGRGVEQNWDTATTLYTQACNAEYAPACSQMGTMLINIPDLADPDAGMAFVQKGCNLGDARGCVQLGVLYLDGRTGTTNIEKAQKIFVETCEEKIGFGCFQLGKMYDQGLGIEENKDKALELFQKGCDMLNGDSCGMLGYRYLKGGGGVMKSTKEAVRYFDLGCEHGDQKSCREMADFYFEGSLVQKDVKHALELYKQSCQLFNSEACLKAGTLMLDESIGEVNYYQALLSFEKGCKMGNQEACTSGEPIMFQARYEGIIQNALKSGKCQVWTMHEDNPDNNREVVRVDRDRFTVLAGDYEGQTFSLSHQTTDYKKDERTQVAQSFWEAKSDSTTLNIEHHENWAYTMVKATQFPGDESFSRDPKGNESVYFSRKNETLRRNTAKKCKYVDNAKLLTSEHCSEVQALVASRLVSKCR